MSPPGWAPTLRWKADFPTLGFRSVPVQCPQAWGVEQRSRLESLPRERAVAPRHGSQMQGVRPTVPRGQFPKDPAAVASTVCYVHCEACW